MTGQESRDDESPDQDLADSELAKKSGLYERMKAGFAALTQRTKKTPAPNTEENIDSSADAHGSSGMNRKMATRSRKQRKSPDCSRG